MQSATRFSSTTIAVLEGLEKRSLFAGVPVVDVQDLGRLAAHQSITTRQSVGLRNTADSYNFTLTYDTEVSVTLSKLDANANLVLKRGRDVIAFSKRALRDSETIGAQLKRGTYKVIVIGPEGFKTTSYRLNVTTGDGAPTRLDAAAWGGSSVHLMWNDNSTAESCFRIDRWTRDGWRRAARVAADSTGTVVEGLVPGYATTYRVVAVDSVGVSLGSTNMATARTSGATGYGRYQISLEAGTRKEAGWTMLQDALSIDPKYRRESLNRRESIFVDASSWQDAVQQVVTGTVKIKKSDGTRADFAFDPDDNNDFAVNTASQLKQSYASNDLVADDDTCYIALEDSRGDIDNDYDDFVWRVKYAFRPFIKSTGGVVVENGTSKLKFQFRLSGENHSLQTFDLNWFDSLSTAKSGVDFEEELPSSITFEPNQTTVNVELTPINNTKVEISRVLYVMPSPTVSYEGWSYVPSEKDIRGFNCARGFIDDDDVGPANPVANMPAPGTMNTIPVDTAEAQSDDESCQTWAFNSAGIGMGFDAFIGSAKAARLLLPDAIDKDGYESASMMKRCIESLLYHPQETIQGYRAYATDTIPTGFHMIVAYWRDYLVQGPDYHYATQDLDPATGARSWSDKEGEADASNDDPYNNWSWGASTYFLSHYIINTPPRQAAATP